jgi:hypothetical protein
MDLEPRLLGDVEARSRTTEVKLVRHGQEVPLSNHIRTLER